MVVLKICKCFNQASPTGHDVGDDRVTSIALNVVSYVGCAVSIISLSLTIICLLVFR